MIMHEKWSTPFKYSMQANCYLYIIHAAKHAIYGVYIPEQRDLRA